MDADKKRFMKLEGIAAELAASKTPVPLELKMRTAELILKVMERRKRFGLFVILGWQRKWQDHLDISDREQDIFAGRHMELVRADRGVASTVDFDGAILIDRRGHIVHSGAMIEGLRPRVVAQKVNPGHFTDLSEQFGFTTKVHTRHLSAIAASFVFKGTTVFTVSEESGEFHVFEAGRIVHHL